MSTQRANFLTPEQYLEIERQAERRSEYYQGQMFAVAGASRKHILIVTNLTWALNQRLRSQPCEIYSVDMRVQVTPAGLYTYPDVVLACDGPKFADGQQDTLLNPVLIIEVLSTSTEDYDRGRKLELYQTLPSLVEYLTIAQDRPHVEHHTPQDNGWLLTDYGDLSETIHLTSVNADLSLNEIYDKVDFDR